MLTQGEIEKEQARMKRKCLSDFKHHLENGRLFFLSLFPNATIRATLETGEKRAPAKPYIDFRIDSINTTIRAVLSAATSPDPLASLQEIELEGFQIPKNLSKQLVQTLVKIISCGRNLQENDLVFVGEICAAMDFPPGEVPGIIDQTQYESRKAFFASIRKQLDEEQQDLCAILLLKAIRADDSVHPAEFKYFENISQLLDYDQARLEHIGVSADTFDDSTTVEIPYEISIYIFEYLIEIVMCDRKYDPKESAFIQQVAKIFGFDKMQQDSIIQPVASAMMTRTELFQ